MDRETEMQIIRRAYAKRVMAAAGVIDRRVEAAFASVPREKFLGLGPWQIVRWGVGYRETPSRDPAYLYDDAVVAIVPERNLNNGQPSLHALLLAAAGPRAGEHAVHIGAGVGYYTALLARLVGQRGKVTAIEYDAALAERLMANLDNMPHVRTVQGDGAQVPFEPADIIYVNTGATKPADVWLDRLRDGGRLILPLTAADNMSGNAILGAVFKIERRNDEFFAERISPVAIFPCVGARDAESAAALAAALETGRAGEVRRLYRADDVPSKHCWLRGKGWCLAYR